MAKRSKTRGSEPPDPHDTTKPPTSKRRRQAKSAATSRTVGKKALLILGVHRGGTSALARVCNLLGVELGSRLLPAQNDNETGFWEHRDIFHLHQELLTGIGSAWDDVRALPEDWLNDSAVVACRDKIIEALRRDFSTSPIWAVKDPRICRLVPLWLFVLRDLGCEPLFLLIGRNPLEVAGSLANRDSFPAAKSQVLWLRHLIDAERDTRGHTRAFITYEGLLQDWRRTMAHASRQLGLEWPRSIASAAGEMDQFLQARLRHQRVDDAVLETDPRLSHWLRDAYRAFRTAVDGEDAELQSTLAGIANGLDGAAPLFEPWIRGLETDLTRTRGEIENRGGEVERLGGELKTAQGTIADRDKAFERLGSKLDTARAEIAERDTEINRLNDKLSAGSNEIERLSRDVAAAQATLAGRDAQIQEILVSTSWRISAPVRWAGTLLWRLKSYHGKRLHHMTLKPFRELDVENGRFRSTGNDPQFLLTSARGRPPCGWVSISYSAEITEDALTPRLYVDDGGGFAERTSIRLQPHLSGRIERLVRLPDRVSALRLDPLARPAIFRLQDLRIRELGRIQLAFFALAWPRPKPALFRPWQRLTLAARTIETLRTGGLEGLKHRFLANADYAGKSLEFGRSSDSYGNWMVLYDSITEADRQAIAKRIDHLGYQPLISIVMPVYNTPEEWLRLAIESVRRQLYPNWELCIADDGSPSTHVRKVLQEYQTQDPRIKVVLGDENRHISAASNNALELSGGEFVALMDHDDELSEHALYMVVEELNRHPDADLIYSDEDKIDESDRRYEPYFKSDWNPDLFYSQNMICHLGVYRASILKKIGGFRLGYEGGQDYDLALRVVEQTSPDRIRHIPHVLYHWRAVPGSSALAPDEKDYATEAARRAIRSHFERKAIPVKVTEDSGTSFHRVIYSLPKDPPLVTVIIPTKDKVGLLRGCIDGILNKTDYRNIEVMIVDNRSEEADTLSYLDQVQEDSRVRIVKYDGSFNFSAINNMAVRQSRGEVIGFINNDIMVTSPGWLSEMVSHALRPEIGAVGAKLYYPDDTIQHAGVIVGIGGVAGHGHKYFSRNDPGYFSRAKLIQNVSAVTGACLVLRREVFEEVGGFEEDNLGVAFNDVDLCLRIREHGYRNLWTPYAELYHLESLSRGSEDTPAKQTRFRNEVLYMKSRWGEALLHDPYYSPNLTLAKEDFSLAFPPAVWKPWKKV